MLTERVGRDGSQCAAYRAFVSGATMTIECWFCDTCKTLTLLAKAQRGECAVEPRRKDCPVIGVPEYRKAVEAMAKKA